MNATSVQPGGWSQRRWWCGIALVFIVQVGFICWFDDKSPLHPRLPAAAPSFRLAGNAYDELLALSDPTLFALPHQQGFSGPAWIKIAPLAFRPFDWSEPTQWLQLPLRKLGQAFDRFIQTNNFDSLQASAISQPELRPPEPLQLTAARQHSALRVEGDLAQRRLLAPLELPSWPHPDILANSVAQLLVNADGEPVSVTLLSGCGLGQADQYALEQARAARFQSLAGSGPQRLASPTAHLAWGTMIFEWNTLPITTTNAPAAIPQP